jgi:hypothetical protein
MDARTGDVLAARLTRLLDRLNPQPASTRLIVLGSRPQAVEVRGSYPSRWYRERRISRGGTRRTGFTCATACMGKWPERASPAHNRQRPPEMAAEVSRLQCDARSLAAPRAHLAVAILFERLLVRLKGLFEPTEFEH